MATYYASLCVMGPHGTGAIRHSVVKLEASNDDEATGKAVRIAEKVWPAKQGWRSHHAQVKEESRFMFVDPAGAFLDDPT